MIISSRPFDIINLNERSTSSYDLLLVLSRTKLTGELLPIRKWCNSVGAYLCFVSSVYLAVT